mmetsp:Transcript_19494/g.35336  ORF Transcript_19494/g.35336 Transcript_19494/m.35336 type:complete len:202 (-) Transcript_19494:110-715(-)
MEGGTLDTLLVFQIAFGDGIESLAQIRQGANGFECGQYRLGGALDIGVGRYELQEELELHFVAFSSGRWRSSCRRPIRQSGGHRGIGIVDDELIENVVISIRFAIANPLQEKTVDVAALRGRSAALDHRTVLLGRNRYRRHAGSLSQTVHLHGSPLPQMHYQVRPRRRPAILDVIRKLGEVTVAIPHALPHSNRPLRLHIE